jgi:carbon storage regulator
MDATYVRRQWIMLVLTRRPAETVVIGGCVTVTVLDIKGGRVRIGVNAPRDIVVNREEIHERTRRRLRMPYRRP